MGAVPAPKRQEPLYRPEPAPQDAPVLREVPRRRRGRIPLAVVILFVLGVIGSPLALNVAAMYADWQVAHLEEQTDELAAEQAALQAQAAALASGERIQTKAEKLGLRPADDIEYVEISGATGGYASAERDEEFAAATR